MTTHYNGIAAPCCKLKVKGFSETNAEEKITLKNINDFIDYSLEEVTTDEVPHEAIRIARIWASTRRSSGESNATKNSKNNQWRQPYGTAYMNDMKSKFRNRL